MSVLKIKANSLKIFDDPNSESLEFLLPAGVHVQMQAPAVSGVIARSVNNVPADANGNINITTSVGGSGSAAVLASIGELQSYSGGEQIVTITDPHRGGTFTKSMEALTADNGVTFAASGGGFWVRKFDRFNGLSVRWFGAIGDGVADDIEAFDAVTAYVTHNNLLDAGSFAVLYDRAKIIVPDGLYRITRTWKIGGAPVSPADAMIYQAYIFDSGAPSYDPAEHAIGGSTLAITIECGARATIIPDFGVLTELTAVVSYGCYSYAYGEQNAGSSHITGLKIKGINAGNYQNFGADGPNLAGLVVYGLIPGISVAECTFGAMQVGFIANMAYMTDFRQFAFNRCGTGFCFVGGHGATGWMFTAYNCELAYDIKSGASAWTQLNSEQCNRALLFIGNQTTFNGVYFEQLNDYSATHPNSNQIQIGDDSGTPSSVYHGVELNAAVVTNNSHGPEIYIGSVMQDVAIMNIMSYGTKYISHNGTRVLTNASEPNFTGNTAGITIVRGGYMSTKDIILAGTITAVNGTFSGAVSAASVQAGNINISGLADLPIDINYGGNKSMQKYFSFGEMPGDQVVLILGKTTNDGAMISGEMRFYGISGGGATVHYRWGADGIVRWIIRYDELPYMYDVPSINIVTFTYSGETYYGLTFDNGYGSYQPVAFLFNGQYIPNGYTFIPINRNATTGLAILEPAESNSAVALGTAAPTYAPLKSGKFYLDYINKKLYVSTGRDSSADWTILN